MATGIRRAKQHSLRFRAAGIAAPIVVLLLTALTLGSSWITYVLVAVSVLVGLGLYAFGHVMSSELGKLEVGEHASQPVHVPEPTGQADVTLLAEVGTSAAPAQVWSVLTDLSAWKRWWDGSKLVRVEPGWKEGAEVTFAEGRPCMISKCVPQSLLAFWSESMGVQTRRSWEIDDSGDGSQIRYRFEAFGASLDPSSARSEEADMTRCLDRLRALLERA